MSAKTYEQYQTAYSEKTLFIKIVSQVKIVGFALVYKALQLYYVAQKPAVPAKVRAAILGALGYFILPLDVIPDFVPGIGYGDDLAALVLAMGVAQMYIDAEIREKRGKK